MKCYVLGEISDDISTTFTIVMCHFLPTSETTRYCRSYSICRTYIGYVLTRHYVVKFDYIGPLVASRIMSSFCGYIHFVTIIAS